MEKTNNILYNDRMNTTYNDIIEIDYEKIKSKRHPQMSKLARAAQFAPFAALSGHEELIEETGKTHTVEETVREPFVEEG